MDTKNVIQLGNPKLRLISNPVNEDEFGTQQLHSLINTLFSIMFEKGGIGIAAPQLGINRRIFVFGLSNNNLPSHIPPIPDTVLINPYTEFLDFPSGGEMHNSCFNVSNIFKRCCRPHSPALIATRS